jgi:hypothetical protein
VTPADFTTEEIALFVARFESTPHWHTWTRTRSLLGRDVIEIVTAGDVDWVQKIAKMEPGRYAATGYGQWSLTLSEDLGQLLGLMQRSAPRRRSLLPEWHQQSAA